MHFALKLALLLFYAADQPFGHLFAPLDLLHLGLKPPFISQDKLQLLVQGHVLVLRLDDLGEQQVDLVLLLVHLVLQSLLLFYLDFLLCKLKLQVNLQLVNALGVLDDLGVHDALEHFFHVLGALAPLELNDGYHEPPLHHGHRQE